MLTIEETKTYAITFDAQGLQELAAAIDDAILANMTPEYIPAWEEILEILQNYI